MKKIIPKKVLQLSLFLILVVIISACRAPNDDDKAETVYYCIKDGADFTAKSIESVSNEIEKERLSDKDEKLGYPEGYDPNNPIANGEFTEEDWAAIQQEEAMNSLAEDAMRAQYEEHYPEEYLGLPY